MSYSDFNQREQTPIIENVERYNGRVNIVEPSPEVLFKMQEKMELREKTTNYREALTGTMEASVLSNAYFSKENIQIVHNGLRAGVYKASDNQYIVPPQNVDIIKSVMRTIFLQYAEHKPDHIKEQIETLNKLVLDHLVPALYNETIGYIKYCRDQSTIATPLEHPTQTDRDYRQIEFNQFM